MADSVLIWYDGPSAERCDVCVCVLAFESYGWIIEASDIFTNVLKWHDSALMTKLAVCVLTKGSRTLCVQWGIVDVLRFYIEN